MLLGQYSTHYVAQSRNQTMYVTLTSHLLEKVFTYGQLQDAGTGQGQGFTRHPTSSTPLMRSVVSAQCDFMLCHFFYLLRHL